MIARDPILSRVFILVGIVLTCWIVYLLKPVLIPFAVAFLLAYLLNPLISYLSRKGISRWLGILLVLFVFGLVTTLTLSFLLPIVFKQIQYARSNLPEFVSWVNTTLLPWVEQKSGIHIPFLNTNEISNALLEYVQQNYSTGQATSVISQIATSGLGLVNVLGLAVLVPVVAFYLLMDWHKMTAKLQLAIPRHYEARALNLAHECNQVFGSFVKGQLLVMVILGVIYAVGLQLVGLELGIIIGVVAGLASIIPYLGFAVGIVAAIVACLFQFGFEWTHLLLVGSVFMAGQLIEGYILQPYLLGDRIGLSPVMVIFSVLAGAALLGFVGMLIALPVAAILMVLVRHAYKGYQQSDWYMGKFNDKNISHAKNNCVSVEDGDLLKPMDLTKHDNTTKIDELPQKTADKPPLAWLERHLLDSLDDNH